MKVLRLGSSGMLLSLQVTVLTPDFYSLHQAYGCLDSRVSAYYSVVMTLTSIPPSAAVWLCFAQDWRRSI
jgi:hypothetical protein